MKFAGAYELDSSNIFQRFLTSTEHFNHMNSQEMMCFPSHGGFPKFPKSPNGCFNTKTGLGWRFRLAAGARRAMQAMHLQRNTAAYGDK